jgi:hypothetical protein
MSWLQSYYSMQLPFARSGRRDCALKPEVAPGGWQDAFPYMLIMNLMHKVAVRER